MGGASPPGGLASVHVAVCTIEKANNLINRLIEEERLSDLGRSLYILSCFVYALVYRFANFTGIVVVDEMHLVSDSHRGYLLELLLTKILLYGRLQNSRKVSSPEKSQGSGALQIQIVGMSASLSTLPVLGLWLKAATYTTDYRPIPLTELVYTKDNLYLVKPGEGNVHE